MSILIKSKRGQCIRHVSFFFFMLDLINRCSSAISIERKEIFHFFFFFLPDKSVEDHDDKFGEARPPKFVLAGFQASRRSIEENRN